MMGKVQPEGPETKVGADWSSHVEVTKCIDHQKEDELQCKDSNNFLRAESCRTAFSCPVYFTPPSRRIYRQLNSG